jgi:hypothetical protein
MKTAYVRSFKYLLRKTVPDVSIWWYRYFPDEHTDAVLFTSVVSKNYWNVIKIARAAFEKIAI